MFREMINCHRGIRKIILDDAYKRWDCRPNTELPRSLTSEQKALELVDHIFARAQWSKRPYWKIMYILTNC